MEKHQIVIEGTLEALSTRDPRNPHWVSKYFVLYAASHKNKSRLDWYDDENAYQNDPNIHKTIFIEEIYNIEKTKDKRKKHAFKIFTRRRDEPFQYAATDSNTSSEWVNEILNLQKMKAPSQEKDPRSAPYMGDDIYVNKLEVYDETAKEFLVDLIETEISKKCELTKQKYILQIYSKYISIVEPPSGPSLYVWPYNYLRRYGRSHCTFTFEAGRKCASGTGVFMFNSEAAEDIFQAIVSANKETTEGSDSPNLPQRQYSEDYAKVISTKGQLGPSPNTPLPATPGAVATKDHLIRKGSGGSKPPPPPKPETRPGAANVYADDPGNMYSEVPPHQAMAIVDTSYDEAETFSPEDSYCEARAPPAVTDTKMSNAIAKVNIQRLSSGSDGQSLEDGDLYYDHITWKKPKSQQPRQQTPVTEAAKYTYDAAAKGKTTEPPGASEATYDEIGYR